MIARFLKKAIGTVKNDNFLTQNTWGIAGSNVWTFGNGLSYSLSNDNAYSHYLQSSEIVHCLSNLSYRIDFTITDVSATAKGWGIGPRSVHANTGAWYNFLFEINTQNGIIQPFFSYLGAGNSATPEALTGSNITCSAGEKAVLFWESKNDKAVITIINQAGQKAVYTAINTFYNTSKICLYALGGTGKFDNFQFSLSDKKNLDYLFWGDSITYGAGASLPENSYVRIAAGNQTFVKAGGSGDRTVESLQALSIMSLYTPKIVYPALGVNVITQGFSMTSWLEHLNTIKNAFSNSDCVFPTITPNPFSDPTGWNAALKGEFGNENVFDVYPLLVGSGYNMNPSYTNDGTHLIDAGQAIYGNALKTFLKARL